MILGHFIVQFAGSAPYFFASISVILLPWLHLLKMWLLVLRDCWYSIVLMIQ